MEAQVITRLHDAGYTTDSESSGTIQGISIDKSSVTIEEGGSTETAIVTLSASNGSTNYVLIDGLYYPLTKTNGEITLGKTGKRELTDSSVSLSDITITPTDSITASLTEITPTTGTLTITSKNVTADQNSENVELKNNSITATINVAVKKASFALAATKASTKIGGTTTLSVATLADYQTGEVSWSVTAGGSYASVPENSKGTSVQVTGLAGGTATITATYTTGSSSITKTAAVEIKQGTLDAQGITWANLSTYAKQISAGSSSDIPDYAAGPIEIGGKTLRIGDTKILEIGNDVYLAQIIGFKHDNLADSAKTGDYANKTKAGITFQLKELMKTTRNMNATKTNSGGWASTAMRSYLNTDSGNVYSQINNDVKNVIVKVKKDYMPTYNSKDQTTVTICDDNLWLLSCSEIWSDGLSYKDASNNDKTGYGYAYLKEGEQYQYYKAATIGKAYNANNSSLVKSILDGDANWWWLRSPHYNANYYFCLINSSGRAYDDTALNGIGVAFGFSI